MSAQRICSRDSPNHDRASGPLSDSRRTLSLDVRPNRALGQVERADAEIPLVRRVLLEHPAQRVGLRERVIHTAVEVDAVGWPANRRGARPVDGRGEDVRGIVERGPAERQRERRPILEDRAADVERRLLGPLRSFLLHERIARVQRVVAEREVHVALQRSGARLGMDVHHRHPAGVVLRREHAAGEADGSDLRLGREPAAAEAVDSDRAAGPGHLLEHPLHLLGIVRQRVDLFLREHVAEPIAVRIGGARRRIAADRDALVDLLDRERHLAPAVAGAHAVLRNRRGVEARKRHLDRIASRRQPLGHRHALRVRDDVGAGDRLGGRLDAPDLHERAGNDRAAGVLDDHAQRGRLRPGLSRRRCRSHQEQHRRRPAGEPRACHVSTAPFSLRTSSRQSSD